VSDAGLRPTPEQYQAFGAYLGGAHSWYKHLPLMTGRRFVVFVSRDAGFGRLVAIPNNPDLAKVTEFRLAEPAEGKEFTEEHPRLHYGWRTTKEYRTRFGHLDYMCRRSDDDPYVRDAGEPVALPDEIEEWCGFVLYPYVSETFADAVAWDVHAEAVRLLRDGAAHPARDQVLELADLAEMSNAVWNRLGPAEQEFVIARQVSEDTPVPDSPSADVSLHLELAARAEGISAALREREDAKIYRALAELDDWLVWGDSD
jgi:hypothetical protein